MMAKKESSELTLKSNRGEKSRNISRDVTISIVLVVVLVSSLVISLNFLIVSRKAKAQLIQKADEYLSYLIDSLELSIWNINEEGVRKIIEPYINNELVARLRITEPTGNISFERIKQHGNDLVEKTGAVTHEGQIIGHVEIGLTSRLYKESNRQLLWSSILTMLVIILALICVTGLLLRVFLKSPLNGLIQGIDRIAKGDYEYKFPKAKQREIKTIITRFNYMAEQIKVREKSLSDIKRRLEEMVKERTRDLKAAQEELVRREKLSVLGQLTATVSHELRNPLGVIGTSAFYLKSNLKDSNEKIQKHLGRIDKQVNLCDSIVNDLLEFTRGRRSEMVEVDLNHWLKEVLDHITVPDQASLARELSPGLPMVLFDRDKLQRVTINLVNNAIQAVIDRHERFKQEDELYQPQVKVATSMVEDGACIEVEDNGIGMDEETAGQAFEPLFTTRARGTGLGLAIVKKIVEEHDGTVSIESEPNLGTKATVVIPVIQE